MSENNSQYNPHLDLPDLQIVENNKTIGSGSFGKVDQFQTALQSEELVIPIKNKATKTFDISRGTEFFQQELRVMKHLKQMANKYYPHFYESHSNEKNGTIVMERIDGIGLLGIAPDPNGEVILDLAVKLAEAIHQTQIDGAVDIDTKLDSYKLIVNSEGVPIKIRLVDMGLFFIGDEKEIKVPTNFINPDIFDLAPEVREYAGVENQTASFDAEKLAVHNLGYILITIISPPLFWFNHINSYENDGVFNRKKFEEDILYIAEKKGIPPLDLNNQRVVEIIDLIESMLNVNPKSRPNFTEILQKLKDLKGDEKPIPCIIPKAVEKMSKRQLAPNREYVVNEKQVMDKIKAAFSGENNNLS